MARLTISAAARLCRMDRRTIQRAIHSGRLHLDAQHCVSTDELILAGYLLDEPPQATPQEGPHTPPQDMPQDALLLPMLERVAAALEGLFQEMRALREVLTQAPQTTPQTTPQCPTALSQTTPQAQPQETPQEPPQVPARPRARGELVTDVLHALAQRETATAAQVATALGDGSQGGIKAVWQTLQRLKQRGAVVQEGRRYRLA